jgi:hypothetical protein
MVVPNITLKNCWSLLPTTTVSELYSWRKIEEKPETNAKREQIL